MRLPPARCPCAGPLAAAGGGARPGLSFPWLCRSGVNTSVSPTCHQSNATRVLFFHLAARQALPRQQTSHSAPWLDHASLMGPLGCFQFSVSEIFEIFAHFLQTNLRRGTTGSKNESLQGRSVPSAGAAPGGGAPRACPCARVCPDRTTAREWLARTHEDRGFLSHPTVCSALSTWAQPPLGDPVLNDRVTCLQDAQPPGERLTATRRPHPHQGPGGDAVRHGRRGEGSWPYSGPWVLFQAYKTFTFGLSPPEASFSFSGCELSAIKPRSDGTTRPALYPDDPAPRGLDGQEFAALRTREGCSHQSTAGHMTL